ncbi:hypothetical protein JCM19275_1292 [Nonlabens ulvanivorans]|uniref:Uncharacterized protein n=1 Tax=Nonlabens ulvanivorans TaxID=906888 RepID=A0A090WK35_NONUL|nr:hypothetical protein JCM19275_1292 [Nonlabens ulvanivorans]
MYGNFCNFTSLKNYSKGLRVTAKTTHSPNTIAILYHYKTKWKI